MIYFLLDSDSENDDNPKQYINKKLLNKSPKTYDDTLPDVKLDNYSLYFVLLCLLLRHYNNKRNFLKFQITSYPLKLPELGDKILDCCGSMLKCSYIYRELCYLKICMKVLSSDSSYFDNVYKRLLHLRQYITDSVKMYTYREELHLKKIIKRMINWCRLCISRYVHVFHGTYGARALRSCVRYVYALIILCEYDIW